MLASSLVIAATITGGFWFFVDGGTNVLFALYVWSGVLATLVLLQLWLVLGDFYTITQAKRLYGLIGAGGVIGAIVGSGIARQISVHLGARHILLASAAILLASALGPLFLPRTEPNQAIAAPENSRLLEDFELVRESPYLQRLAGLVLLSTIVFTLIDFVFKSLVAEAIEPQHLATFFSTIDLVFDSLALLIQVFMVGWLFRFAGLTRALSLLPLLLIGGISALLVGGGLVAGLALRGTSGMFRHTVHQTGLQLLYVPVADDVRGRAKTFIDVFAQRGGQALASVGILLTIALGWGLTELSGLLAVIAAAWVVAAVTLKPHYTDLFRNALRRGAISTRVNLPAFDIGSLETLVTSLSSTDDAEVLTALSLLAEQGKTKLIPGLIAYHPSPKIVERAIGLFVDSNRADFVPIGDRLLEDPNPEIRALVLRARSVVRPDKSILRSFLDDPAPTVRIAALVGLVAHDWVQNEDPDEALLSMASESIGATRALSRAILRQPDSVFSKVLVRLAETSDESVRCEVAQAMGAIGKPEFVPHLICLLRHRRARPTAGAALLSIEPSALPALLEALVDESLDLSVRLHIPRAICRFNPEQSGPFLLERLMSEPLGILRYKILCALGRMRRSCPELELDEETITSVIEHTLRGGYEIIEWRHRLHEDKDPKWATPARGLLISLLDDRVENASERVFRLLSLQWPEEDFETIHRGIQSQDPKICSSGNELLANVVDPELHAAVVGLASAQSDHERLKHCGHYYQRRNMNHLETLKTLIAQGGEAQRGLAIYHIGELGLCELRPMLSELEVADSAYLREVVQCSLELLEHTAKEQVSA